MSSPPALEAGRQSWMVWVEVASGCRGRLVRTRGWFLVDCVSHLGRATAGPPPQRIRLNQRAWRRQTTPALGVSDQLYHTPAALRQSAYWVREIVCKHRDTRGQARSGGQNTQPANDLWTFKLPESAAVRPKPNRRTRGGSHQNDQRMIDKGLICDSVVLVSRSWFPSGWSWVQVIAWCSQESPLYFRESVCESAQWLLILSLLISVLF